jgi:hypothetical protein
MNQHFLGFLAFISFSLILGSCVSFGSATVLDVTVEDQTSLNKGESAYVLFYQKISKPYPDYVTIFDMRDLIGDKDTDTFYVNASLVVAAQQQNGNTWIQCKMSFHLLLLSFSSRCFIFHSSSPLQLVLAQSMKTRQATSL